MRFARAATIIGLGMGLLGFMPLLGQADVAHFHNGKILRGSLYRITGDLIEFKPEGGKEQTIQRIWLTNRRDVVELNNQRKVFGEIIYIDRFKVEINTATGRQKIKRRHVRNLVMGTPAQQPMTDFIESTSQQTARQGLYSYQPGDLPTAPDPMTPQPRVDFNEDRDVIPTDRMSY